VVAEGVETEEERRLLAELGCPCLQGYLFARPMPEDDWLRWLGDPARGKRMPATDGALVTV
jgi:EAL domain-containing protein (putative c-di-GMP-specific phosphodiesterase class I)